MAKLNALPLHSLETSESVSQYLASVGNKGVPGMMRLLRDLMNANLSIPCPEAWAQFQNMASMVAESIDDFVACCQGIEEESLAIAGQPVPARPEQPPFLNYQVVVCAGADLQKELKTGLSNIHRVQLQTSVADGNALFNHLATSKVYPHMVFMDSRLAMANNGQLIENISASHPGLQLMIVLHDEPLAQVLEVMRLGYHFFCKASEISRVMDALRTTDWQVFPRAEIRYLPSREQLGESFNSTETHLLNLLHRRVPPQTISLCMAMSMEEVSQTLGAACHKLSKLGLLVDSLRQGLMMPDDKPVHLDPASMFYFKDGRAEVPIRLRDIVIIEADNNYVRVQTADKQNRLFLGKLSNFEIAFNGSCLKRISRSFIINTEFISYIQGDVIGIDGRELTLGKLYANSLKR